MKKTLLTFIVLFAFYTCAFTQSKQKSNSEEKRIQALEREIKQLKSQNNQPREQQVLIRLIEKSCGYLSGSSKGEKCDVVTNYIFVITNKYGKKVDYAISISHWYNSRYFLQQWKENGDWKESYTREYYGFKNGITVREIITAFYYGKCGSARYHEIEESSLGFRIENETSTSIDTKYYNPSSD